MSLENETTRFLAASATSAGLPTDGPPGPPGGNEPAGSSESIIGSRVGAYLITKRIGAGGVGEVFKGVDVMLQREVAIKVLRDELTSDPVFLKRFSNEAQFLAKLSHPNVASVHAFLNEGGKQYMVMEYVPGISLDEFIRTGGPVPVERALAIFRKALEGIGHAHAHGIVLYTLLAGRPPFQGQGDHALMLAQLEQAPPPLHSLVDNVPPKLEAAVMRALEKDPVARFQSVAAFAQAMASCLAELATAAAPAVGSLDAQTSSRTVINPVLQGAQWLPSSGAGGVQGVQPAGEDAHPHPHPHAPSAGPRRNWPWMAAGAAALGVVALGLGVLLWPKDPKPAASNPTVPAPSAAQEAATNPIIPAAPAPAAPVVAAKPHSVVIVRVPSDGPASSAGGAAELGAAGSDALHRFKPGERIRLRVTPSQDAHVYCYLQNEAGRVVRFYPNRFNTSARVRADAPLEIPGAMRFELFANNLQVPETIACFSSERDVAGSLPASVLGDDLAELPVASLAEVRQAFVRAAADGLAEGQFQINFK